MLVDSHAHLNFKAYKDDLSEVIGRCHQAPMKVINVGAAYDSSLKAANLALAEPSFYASIGLHPIHVYDEEFKVEDYQDLINSSKDRIVAIGETGFDYFHLWQSLKKHASSVGEVKAKQAEVFKAHIKLAKKNKLPLIVHGRNGKEDKIAYQDIYQVLKDEGANRGVIHCYGGNLEEAKQFVELGFYLGFTGIVTFEKKAEELQEIAKWIPEDKMLIETDAPYLAPVPYRGKRNEPAYVQYVAKQIAQLLGKTEDEIIEITGDNAIKLFNLK
ncbi:TatD family hydrolase [bacterium]|nr:TatD family hydrolase [bacterium]